MADADGGRKHGRDAWRRVCPSHPCPICGKTDWCAVSVDGALAKCQRIEQGAFKTAAAADGTPYYLHRPTGTPRPFVEPPPPPGGDRPQRADADALHAAYDALLARLALSQAHRQQLRRRGLSDDEIDRRLYRSLPRGGRAQHARELAERFGAEQVLAVPGFAVKNKDGKRWLTIAGAAGLLVPVRDGAGRIVALKVRRDDVGDGPRYSYLSSIQCGGPGPGAPAHVPLGVAGPCPLVRVTEGELKADVATALSGLPTVSAPGCAKWAACLPVLRRLEAATARVAFDADAAEKPAVARALAACVEGLAAAGLVVEVERWDAAAGKGIDDVLAQGCAALVLTGDAVRSYAAEVLALATVGEEPGEPDPLDRLGDVLAEGGAGRLYGDPQLLDALARLAESNPTQWASRRVQLKAAGVSLRDFDRALAGRRAALRAELPPRVAEAGYRVAGGRLVRETLTPNGAVEVPLASFTARIVAETTIDDGAERSVRLTVEGQLCDGRPLSRVEVPAADFAGLAWILPAWGTRAVVYAGRGTADHLRAAVQLLSDEVAERVVYGHLGWREIGERWVYLHAGGAIGADGPVEGALVDPPAALRRYVLPRPPTGEALRRAVRASLALLDFGPPRLAFPLVAAVYRAVLGGTDFALHLAGQTGAFKSEAAALMQQNYGAEMERTKLPAGWSSTGNALEGIAFAAKDALLVIDDFAPSGSAVDVARLHREAERIFRAQGNAAGRQRMRADGRLRPEKPPRGLILSTGEDVPRGQSVRARLFVLEVSRGDFSPDRLTACQRDAAAGRYAGALAGFVRWLAPQYEDVRRRLPTERAELRDGAAEDGQHARTPGIVADLALGLKYLFDFAAEAGAITHAERDALARRDWEALGEAAAAQAEHGRAVDPVEQFLRLLSAAVASRRAHLADTSDNPPAANPQGWGWQERSGGSGENAWVDWQPQGERVGWIDGEQLLLEPEASYAAAQGLAGRQGESLSINLRTLLKRLHERGLLSAADTRGGKTRLTVRRQLEGRQLAVIVLRGDCLSPQESGQSGHSDDEPRENGHKPMATNPPEDELQPTLSPSPSGDGPANGAADGRRK